MTATRTIFHRSEGSRPSGLDETLSAEGYAEFYGGPVKAARLAFTLRKAGLSILVHDDDGNHVGTFADPARAIADGFDNLDRAGAVRTRKDRIAPPRRAKRRPVRKPQP